MNSGPFDDLPEWAEAVGEFSVGSAVLAVRWLNKYRDQDRPGAEFVDASLTALGEAVEPVSDVVANTLMIGSFLAPPALRDFMVDGRDLVAKAPHLARIVGLHDG